MVKTWPFSKVRSDLQLRNERVTKICQVYVYKWKQINLHGIHWFCSILAGGRLHHSLVKIVMSFLLLLLTWSQPGGLWWWCSRSKLCRHLWGEVFFSVTGNTDFWTKLPTPRCGQLYIRHFPETNTSHLKIGHPTRRFHWNWFYLPTIHFQRQTVRFQGCNSSPLKSINPKTWNKNTFSCHRMNVTWYIYQPPANAAGLCWAWDCKQHGQKHHQKQQQQQQHHALHCQQHGEKHHQKQQQQQQQPTAAITTAATTTTTTTTTATTTTTTTTTTPAATTTTATTTTTTTTTTTRTTTRTRTRTTATATATRAAAAAATAGSQQLTANSQQEQQHRRGPRGNRARDLLDVGWSWWSWCLCLWWWWGGGWF